LRLAALMVAMAASACMSAADLDAQYERGNKAARDGDCDKATADLESFTSKACSEAHPAHHCREAYLGLGRCDERRAEPARAWVAFDHALAMPPHARDAAVREDLERAQQEMADKKRDGNLGPVIIRYRDEVTDEYTAKRVVVSIDFDPVYTKEKDAGDLRSPDFTKVYGGLVNAGTHVLVVEAAHNCKPGGGVRCAASVAHQAWTFQTEAKTPLTLEVRTYAEPGEGDAAARPTLEMKIH
jgi:hypothetical protein